MEGAVTGLVGKIAEAGVLVAFELLVIVGLAYAYRQLTQRNNELVDLIFGMHKETLGVVSKNSEVMTRLAEKIDAKNNH